MAAACQLASAGVFAVALLSGSVVMAGLLLFAGSAVLGAAGPCLDAVRLDVLPAEMRGRAEAGRGLLTLGSGALGPLAFGLIAGLLASQGQGLALRDAFLCMLVPLAAGAVVLLAAVRPYAADAAAAQAASDEPDGADDPAGSAGSAGSATVAAAGMLGM